MSKPRKWNNDQLRVAVEESFSVRQVIQRLGLKPAGGNYDQINKYIKELGLNTLHFTGRGWNVGLKFRMNPPKPIEEILVKNSTYQSYKLKKRLFSEGLKKTKCELCGWAQRSVDGRIPVELDHINGDKNDNRLKNLRILCPNCHSLQPTHRALNSGKNKQRGRGGTRYTRET
ncbi:MAG: HNH endonuclease signature motif containing protein [Candidatus Spechtbacterales bacterium]